MEEQAAGQQKKLKGEEAPSMVERDIKDTGSSPQKFLDTRNKPQPNPYNPQKGKRQQREGEERRLPVVFHDFSISYQSHLNIYWEGQKSCYGLILDQEGLSLGVVLTLCLIYFMYSVFLSVMSAAIPLHH